MFAILWTFGNLDYATVFSLAPFISENIITIIGICLLIGAMAKSSQVGLHVWLPLAMEGPTPVSALIHAATMVTAGVYLLMRSSPLIEYSSTVLILCLWLGAITTVFSSLIGLFQQDIKKVIAYSTMSQLAREYNNLIIIFRHQTVCEKVICKRFKLFIITNSQVTNAHHYHIYTHIYNDISDNSFNSFPCLVEQSWLLSILVFLSRRLLWIIFVFFTNIRQYFCILIYTIMSEKWRVIINRKLVGTSEAIRLILIFLSLYKFILALGVIGCLSHSIWENDLNIVFYISMFYPAPLSGGWFQPPLTRLKLKGLVKNYSTFILSSDISEANPGPVLHNNKPEDKDFHEWLAGLIDGDGYFSSPKNGSPRFTITMDSRDIIALYEIKHKFGGSIRPVSGANAVRFSICNKKGLIKLINAVNGLIRNPVRMLQMNKLCVKYRIELKYPVSLTYNNGWLSGFIDSDGSVYFNEASGQVFISATQKNIFLLEPLIKIYSGRIDAVSPKIDAFKYIIYRKQELFNLVDNYFNRYPLRTLKAKRVKLIKEFFLLRPYKNSKDIVKFNEWISFKDRWEKYKD